MVLSRIPEEQVAVRHRTANHGIKVRPCPVVKPRQSPSNVSTRSASLTTAIANETLSSTTSTDDTLSMISTPWSTESWKSQTGSSSQNSPSRLSWTNSEVDSATTLSVGPGSTTTYGIKSPEIKSGSNLTMTLLEEVLSSPSGSRYVHPLTRQTSASTPTYASWTVETYTSTGLVSSFGHDAIQVNYPWSPSTFMSGTEFTDPSYYPSSLTLISQKCSREGFGKFEAKKPLTPMNYVVFSKDDHPMLDWILVKQKGIPIRKE